METTASAWSSPIAASTKGAALVHTATGTRGTGKPHLVGHRASTAHEPPPPPDPSPYLRPSAEALANGVVAWFKERTGRGPQRCQISVRDDDVLVLLRCVQTPVEQTLVAAGRAELVEQLRRTICDIDGEDLCALISSTIGRPVQAMLSDHDPASDTSALVFLLEHPN